MKYYREYKEPRLVREEPKKYHGDPGVWSYQYVTVREAYEKPMLEDGGVPEHGEKFTITSWWFRSHYHKNYAVVRFRFDPVPGVHKRSSGGFGIFYKRPKTTNERRLYYAYGDEYVRGRRRAHNLPNTWDDYVRSDVKTKKSWKKVKKEKQWQRKEW